MPWQLTGAANPEVGYVTNLTQVFRAKSSSASRLSLARHIFITQNLCRQQKWLASKEAMEQVFL